MSSRTDSRATSSFWPEKAMRPIKEIKGVKHDMDERVLIREILEELDVR